MSLVVDTRRFCNGCKRLKALHLFDMYRTTYGQEVYFRRCNACRNSAKEHYKDSGYAGRGNSVCYVCGRAYAEHSLRERCYQ
jgi:hypothetical protein